MAPVLKESGKNHSNHNGTSVNNTMPTLNGGIDHPLSPSKEHKLNRVTSFKKNVNKKIKHWL